MNLIPLGLQGMMLDEVSFFFSFNEIMTCMGLEHV